ncbi:Zn-ribbon domain-containing OB-fold protein [Pseudooceanicola aestuarii]|uniref:Zn-ribbon domain-containing OB-fold protein n=1 Tax=Pseudooceanicola aestuarii TaxID=2697319 RepID=UPI0013D30841|nr:OB-fold domain-containing protein [Pseudooceanicola aestuarii]
MNAIRYQFCPACDARWYLPRPACPRCGGAAQTRQAAGTGHVYAVTTQHRAPARDFPVAPPWRIGLIDLAEGVRVMGHVDPVATIGARVHGEMRDFAGASVPAFDTIRRD